MSSHNPYVAFRFRNFRLLFTATTLSVVGGLLESTALGWELYERTGSALTLGNVGLAEFLPVRYALAAKGIACLARTHSRDPDDVSKVCDSFDGVVVPYVEEVEHARRLAAAAIYRPLKGQALDRLLSTGEWPSEQTRQYVQTERCVNTVFVPMIESLRGIENLDRICGIDGVHAVFVGPNDLTSTMGVPNEYDHPDLIAQLQRIIDTAARSHVSAGCWFGKRSQAERTIRQGARFIVYSNDGALLKEALEQSFAALRQTMK